MKDVIPNKKLRENILWFKSLLEDQKIGSYSQPPQIQPLAHIQPSIYPHNPIQMHQTNPMPVMPVYHPIMRAIINPAMPLVGSGNEYRKNNMEIDQIAENNETEMTPEEKMQLFNRKLIESESVRRKSEDKTEDNKSITSAEKKSVKSGKAPSFSHMPSYPINPGMNVGMQNPYAMHAGMTPYPRDPRMDPRMYGYMMPGYPYMGMMPYAIPPIEDKKK